MLRRIVIVLFACALPGVTAAQPSPPAPAAPGETAPTPPPAPAPTPAPPAAPAPAPQPAGPCPDLPSYKSALSLHNYWAASACRDEGTDDCIQERAAIAKLEEMGRQCLAGQNVGPAPSQAELQREVSASTPAGPRTRTRAVFEGVIGGGLAAGDSDWRHAMEVSPTIGVRVGAMYGLAGGLLAGEWTPVRLTNQNAIIPGTTIERSLYRYRLLAEGVIEKRVLPQLALDARAGIGVDLADASYRKSIGGFDQNINQTDVGLAAELAAAAWWKVDYNVDVGGTLALPISYHSSSSMDPTMPSFAYTGVDVQLMLGVRVLTGQ